LANHRTISYLDVKDWLPLENGDWSGQLWTRLLASCLINHQKIADYFGVQKGFKVLKNSGGYDVFGYEGDA
jgi:hypothetical protein